jgi:tRNA(fMet)-specific endonuclease VapC
LTSVRYLPDTNIASFIIKGKAPSLDRRMARIPMSDVCISSVTEGELRFGVELRPEATRLRALVNDFLLTITILPWDSAAARCYGKVRAELEAEGKAMGNPDTMIGSHASALSAVLVTNDAAFVRIAGLKVVDWTKA